MKSAREMKTAADYIKLAAKYTVLHKKWRTLLALDSWSITLDFDYDEYPANAADCATQPEYEQAQIVVHLVKVAHDYPKDHQLEAVVVHELVHAMSWGSNETECERITKTVLRVYDHNMAKKPERDFK